MQALPSRRGFSVGAAGSEIRSHYHGQPVRLAHHEACRRDARRSRRRYDARIVSAHRTPGRLYAFAKGAKAAGFKVIIAGAGGAAHLPGMTPRSPPAGVRRAGRIQGAVRARLALFHRADAARRSGRHAGDRQAGAINAALLAASVLALSDPALGSRLEAWRQRQTAAVAEKPKDPETHSKQTPTRIPARERCRARSRARSHDRHPRRRPARPDAGACRRAARLQVPRLAPDPDSPAFDVVHRTTLRRL